MKVELEFVSRSSDLATVMNRRIGGYLRAGKPWTEVRIGDREGQRPRGESEAWWIGRHPGGIILNLSVRADVLDLADGTLPSSALVLAREQDLEDAARVVLRASCRSSLDQFSWRLRTSLFADPLPPNAWVELEDNDSVWVEARYGVDRWEPVLGAQVVAGCQVPWTNTRYARTREIAALEVVVDALRHALGLALVRGDPPGQLDSRNTKVLLLAHLRRRRPQLSDAAVREAYLGLRCSHDLPGVPRLTPQVTKDGALEQPSDDNDVNRAIHVRIADAARHAQECLAQERPGSGFDLGPILNGTPMARIITLLRWQVILDTDVPPGWSTLLSGPAHPVWGANEESAP